MEQPEHPGPSQHVEQVHNSAISNLGTAITINVDGNQYMYTSASPRPQTPPLRLLPRAQPFIGREQDLAWLLNQLREESGQVVALCGPGGMGKTALAAEALADLTTQPDWKTCFPGGIFSFSFYPSPSLPIAFEELARFLGEEPGADPHRAALRALSRCRTLLVFDGVEVLADPQPLRELGSPHVVLLLSRRQSDARDLAHRRTLDLLSPEQAITLLQQLAGPRAADQRSTEQLVQQIGGYPLALQLIGSYLASRQEEAATYLAWWKQERLAALHHGEHHVQSVLVLLRRTYDSLPPAEQAVFALLGLLAPAAFPWELVQGVLDQPERAVRHALGSLVNLSILRRPGQAYEVSHPLIHTFAMTLLSSESPSAVAVAPEILALWQERFLSTLMALFDQSSLYDVALTPWLPHLRPLLSAPHLTAHQSLLAARLFNRAGNTAFHQGKYSEAEPLYERALAIYEQQCGPEHPATATSLNNLAALYDVQGNFGQARPLYERALAIRQQQHGPEHPATAESLNNLAALYDAQGNFEQAKPLYERALAICQQQVGPEHPATARGLNNLAALYQKQGNLEQAEPLLQRALAIRQQQLGSQHPHMADSLNNLAALYDAQGKYSEAEPLYKQALAIYEQQLGSEHPAMERSLNNLAALYQKQGNFEQAEPLYERVLAIRQQRLGPEHPATARGLTNLATCYFEQNKYQQAKPLYERALAICQQQGESSNPLIATIHSKLWFLFRLMHLEQPET